MIANSQIDKGEHARPMGLITHRQYAQRTALTADVIAMRSGEQVILAGRIISRRDHGKVLFLTIEDGTGTIQVLCDSSVLSKFAYQDIRDGLHTSDIVETHGETGCSRRGTPLLLAQSVTLLAKCLCPPSLKRSPAERFGSRAADLLTNPKAKQTLHLRSAVIRTIRDCLDRRGFLEFQTPVVQPCYGGGKSQPFRTFARAHEQEMFLRVTSELYLKRLVIGGFEKVYELSACFRNEGIGSTLSPEFTMLEMYEAYAGTEKMMRFIGEIVGNAADISVQLYPELAKTMEYISRPWTVLSYREACDQYLDARWGDHDDVPGILKNLRDKLPPGYHSTDAGSLHLKIIDKLLSPYFLSPTFLTGLPTSTSPLMCRKEDSPGELDRAWGFLNGKAFCDVGNELNDPFEQSLRLADQSKVLSNIHQYKNEDPLFIEALNLGMPPLAGVGFGVDRFLMIFLGADHIREVVPFPFSELGAPSAKVSLSASES
jgi:lysyl-tRNA synthetase, class II